MDLSKTSTRGLRDLWAFHTRFNATLKVTTCGLEHLRREVDHSGGSQVLNAILRETNEQWNPGMMLSRPVEVIDYALRDQSLLGIAHVFSAFDDYITRSAADLDSWESLLSKRAATTAPSPAARGASDEDGRSVDPLKSFAKRIAFEGDLTDRAPIEHYMRLVRNCAVHREGRASTALVACAESDELIRCHTGWSAHPNRPLPQLPALALGKHIEVRPRHAILATNVCFDIARALDTHLVQAFGADGITFLAARDALLRGRFEEWDGAYRSPEAVVAWTLKRVHHANDFRTEEIAPMLKRLGVWDERRESYRKTCARNGVSA